jgi:tetratricopeptide (TPR) repeat protein
MANLLPRDNPDDSAPVFVQMAIYLMPQMTDGHLLLAAIDARNERYEEAINAYHKIGPDNEYYLDARRRAAELMEENNDTEGALKELTELAKDQDDILSLIKIGDLYRRQENFSKAVEYYNQAADHFDNKVPKEYWQLLYVRGMSYERLGDWEKAENDLKAALAFQPDQPFVLNYIAYAWTDRGEHLEEALALVKKAAELQPGDGYIADSLGWVYYRLGRYDEALPHLEKAVELLPYDAIVNDHLGDSYWQTGRKREARFQWQRAENFSKDPNFIAKVGEKIDHGPALASTPQTNEDTLKEAHSSEGNTAPDTEEKALPQ